MNQTRMTCEHCSDIIGVYEPLVIVVEGDARATSCAAEPTIGSAPGQRYHGECFVERFGSPPPE